MSEEKSLEPIMVYGTDGRPDYLAFARHGDVALSVKPQQIKSGKAYGSGDTVWIAARLRAAEAPDQLPALPPTAPTNIVQFDKEAAFPGSPFTAVTWEKEHAARCSTTIGGLFPGSLDSTAQCLKLVEDLESGAVSTKMATYLATLAEGGQMMMTVEQLAEQLQSVFFGKIAEKSRKHLTVAQKIEQDLSSSIGSFGMQAKLLKAAYTEIAVPDATENDADAE